MRTDFKNGSFMLSWQKCTAWYDPQGNLTDAEYKRFRRGERITVNVSEKHVHVRDWLNKQGKLEIDLLNRGILKRHYKNTLTDV